MRILHYVWSTNFGGIERLVLDLASAQRECCGHEVGCVTGQDNGEFSHEFRAGFDEFVCLDLMCGRDQNKVKREIAVEAMRRFDLIHLHTYNPLVCQASRQAGRPVVYTEHGNFGFGRKRTFRDYFKTYTLSRMLNRHVDYITFNSEFTMSFAAERYALGAVPRSVVYNGVCLPDDEGGGSLELIDSEIADRLRGKFIVGTTSRFAGFKRVDRLISGFAEFQSGLDDVVLLLVGDGPLRSKLETHARSLGIHDKVVFAGFRRNIGDYQNCIDVSVFASENEPFGLVAVETLSRGKPTVVFRDGGGIIEIVEPVAPNDIADSIAVLASRLLAYYRDRGSLKDSDGQRRERASQFGIEAMAANMDSVYQKVARNPVPHKGRELA